MRNRPIAFTLLLIVGIISCHQRHPIHLKTQPARLEKIEGNPIPMVILTAAAEKRLGIEGVRFKRDSAGQRVIPLSALIYDNNGGTWVFTNPSQYDYHREHIRILHTQKDKIRIESAISDEVPIVIQGVAELYGAESGVGK
jgi:hypothetical protein